MSRRTLLVYNKEKFEEFYKEFSMKYKIVSISSLFNTSMQFEDEYLSYEDTLVDITALIKLISSRPDVLMFYEVIINHLLNEYNVKILVEHGYVKDALNLFPQYFSEENYLTNIKDTMDNEEYNNKNDINTIKDIIVYHKDNYKEMLTNKKTQNVEVISITQIIERDYLFSYILNKKLLNEEKKYAIDITSMLRLVNAKEYLTTSFELILIELSKLDNIEFIIDNDYRKYCQDLFRYAFKQYIETQPQEHTTKVNEEIKEKAIINLNQDELEGLCKSFDNELFGHRSFKEDFKQKIKDFHILNKIGVKKIFSIFLCGHSGLGKTEVARILHRNLYPCSKEIKINFGNYSGKGSLWSLIGSPKGYYGSERGGELTNKILHSNSKVILIDEFEKAHESIFNFFYELLEDGRFTDLDENEVDLNGYIIIFTSNLTEEDYKNKIPDALLSRFTMRYELIRLSNKDKQNFMKFKITQLIDRYNAKFKIELDDSKIDSLLSDSLDLYRLNNLREINDEITNKFVEWVSQYNK